MATKRELSYQQAYDELSAIVAEMEHEEMALDLLAEKIKRAAVLIQFCKEKLRTTEDNFNAILKQIEEP